MPVSWRSHYDENTDAPPHSALVFLVLFLIPGWILSRNIIVVSQLKEPHEFLYCRLSPNFTHLPLVTLAKPITAECPYSRILCVVGTPVISACLGRGS